MTRRWVVGHDLETNLYHLVEVELVGDELNGKQTVDLRPECQSSALLTVDAWKLFETRQRAHKHCELLQTLDALTDGLAFLHGALGI